MPKRLSSGFVEKIKKKFDSLGFFVRQSDKTKVRKENYEKS